MNLKRTRDKVLFGLIFASIAGLLFIAWLAFGNTILIFSLVIMLLIVIILQILQLINTHSLIKDEFWNYHQTNALFSIYSVLKPTHPLPLMGRWVIKPDLAFNIISLIKEHKPKTIFEVGSGVSTLISGYCVKEIGEGRIISFEHKKEIHSITADHIRKHGLQDFAEVVYAPLKEITIKNKTWLWYDTVYLRNIKSIDMLIIDGPPGDVQKNARYPALSVLFNLLGAGAVVLVDDCAREDNKIIIDLWLKEFNNLKATYIDTQTGAVLLKKI